MAGTPVASRGWGCANDALVLTLSINGFDVHRVLVDPSNAADLLQLPPFE